jgi:hypothetical protein
MQFWWLMWRHHQQQVISVICLGQSGWRPGTLKLRRRTEPRRSARRGTVGRLSCAVGVLLWIGFFVFGLRLCRRVGCGGIALLAGDILREQQPAGLMRPLLMRRGAFHSDGGGKQNNKCGDISGAHESPGPGLLKALHGAMGRCFEGMHEIAQL